MTQEKKQETQLDKRKKELAAIIPEKNNSGLFYTNPTKKLTFKLYDLDEDTAFRILRDYLFKDRYYAVRRKIDLWVILAHSNSEMYESKSNVSNAVFRPGHSFKMSKPIRTYEMKKEFLNRMEMDEETAAEIFIEKSFIREVIDNYLIDEAQAVLKWFLFKRVKLSVHNPKLAKFQHKLDKMHPDTRRDLRDSAILALVDTIILIQEQRKDLLNNPL